MSHRAFIRLPFQTVAALLLFLPIYQPQTFAQTPAGTSGEIRKTSLENEDLSISSGQVDINPLARDDEIQHRLQDIFAATDWFRDPRIEVKEGVVFLKGGVASDKQKDWAGDLARNTQDVAAVVNQLAVIEPSIWDFSPAWKGLLILWRDVIRSLPFAGFGLIVMALSLAAGLLVIRGMRHLLRLRIRARLLRNVVAGAIGVLVFLIGTYIVLRVSGLTQLALTVVGGTGLIGLAVGIAFRDITENFLASVFLSMQRPFESGDLVEVSGVTGYVQQLNVRTTILMTLEGNLVQIPNASVYKSTLRNFTTNANRREDFSIGIGYDDSVDEAQEIARLVLADHPAVLGSPAPSVLAESLGKATVNLRIYFWINGREYSWLKVRSSLIRLIKRAYQENGISMPDEAREVIFPQGIPIVMSQTQSPETLETPLHEPVKKRSFVPEDEAASNRAEDGLHSEAGIIRQQAQQAHSMEDGENLLPVDSDAPPSH